MNCFPSSSSIRSPGPCGTARLPPKPQNAIDDDCRDGDRDEERNPGRRDLIIRFGHISGHCFAQSISHGDRQVQTNGVDNELRYYLASVRIFQIDHRLHGVETFSLHREEQKFRFLHFSKFE